MVKDQLLCAEGSAEAAGGVLQYVVSFQDRLHIACDLARSNLQAAKSRMKAQYDKKSGQMYL